MRKIALDLGFGNFKAAEVNGTGQVYTNTIPSVFAQGAVRDLGALAVGLGRRRVKVEPATVAYGDLSFIVGYNVHQHSRIPDRLTFQRLGDENAIRPLAYVALASRMNGGPYEAGVLVGLPVEVMQDTDINQVTMANLKRWLVGEHVFRLNDAVFQVNICKVRGVAQPLGSYFAWGLGTDGQWRRSQDDWRATCVVADIGFNTVDLFGIQAGQIVSRYTGGQELGMHRAAREVKAEAMERKVRISLYEADDLVQTFVETGRAEFEHPGGVTNFASIIEAALSDVFGEIAEFIKAKLDQGRYRYLILTGGGTRALKGRLLVEFPQAIILPDPVTANANGLARFAVRKGVL